MTDPKTYIRSRANAVAQYIEENNTCITHNPVLGRRIVARLLNENSNITMRKADEVYEAFVKHYGYKKKVKGETYDEWVALVMKDIADYQDMKNMSNRDVCAIMGIKSSQFGDYYNKRMSLKGRRLWEGFQKLVQYKRRDVPIFHSQLSYWRRVG